MSERIYNDLIIDGHTHIASTRFIPRAFLEGVASNAAARMGAMGVRRSLDELVKDFEKRHQDHDGDHLISEMDAAGIAQSVLLLPDFTHVMEAALSISDMFDRHHAILKRHPGRFHVFAGVDPFGPQDGVALFEKGVTEYGFSGLKLYPPCGYSPSDRALYPYFELCRQHGLPVLLHIGPTAPTLSFCYSAPYMLDQAARDFPGVNFILAHGAVHFVEDCVALCGYRPNVYMDISAFTSSDHPGGWRVALTELFARNINHKIIFGTDWPVSRTLNGHKKTLDAFLHPEGPLARVSGVQRRWIMLENMQRVLPARTDAAPGQRS